MVPTQGDSTPGTAYLFSNPSLKDSEKVMIINCTCLPTDNSRSASCKKMINILADGTDDNLCQISIESDKKANRISNGEKQREVIRGDRACFRVLNRSGIELIKYYNGKSDESRGFAPGPTMTSSGVRLIPRWAPAVSAIAERNSLVPAGDV